MMILNRKDFIYIFPIIALIYVLLANISLSMLLESEYFVWFMIIFPLFIDSFQNPINLVK
jgi:hypothetical protein